jgi:DNA-binding transcriptional MerR regulator
MFKIGEFSRIGQVSVRMLRHYDKMRLLTPKEVDKFTGYRYYTLDQLPRLNRILALKDLGLSLEEIADLIENDLSPQQLRGMLIMKQAQIQQALVDEQKRLQRVANRLRQIETEDQPSPYEMLIKDVEPMILVKTHAIVPNMDEMPIYRCGMFEEVHGWLEGYGVEPAAPEVMIYHLWEYREEDIEIEVGVPIPEDAADELRDRIPQGLMLQHYRNAEPVVTTVHSGPIYDIGQAVVALAAWVKDNNYEFAGPIFEHHLSGRETSKTDFDNITFEFHIPVTHQ